MKWINSKKSLNLPSIVEGKSYLQIKNTQD